MRNKTMPTQIKKLIDADYIKTIREQAINIVLACDERLSVIGEVSFVDHAQQNKLTKTIKHKQGKNEQERF